MNSIVLKSQGVGDLFRLYVFAQRDQFDYNLAYIPPDLYPQAHLAIRYSLHEQALSIGLPAGLLRTTLAQIPAGL